MFHESFDFYGYQVEIRADKHEAVEDLRRDFSFFRAVSGERSVLLEVIDGDGRANRLPKLRAALLTPRNIVYRDGDISYVDYFGKALTIYRSKERHYKIYCRDRDLGHEVAYLTILSLVGQHLDSIGLHRVHALGIAAGGRAVLILLAMAGGKTTLALKLLGSEGIKLLSEDSPLISRTGEVLPFPLRIGVRPGTELSGIPSKYLRTVTRMEYGPKTLVDIEHFSEKIANPLPPGAILLGERWLAGPSRIYPESRRKAIKPFIKNSVVGLGLYQGMEFLLERSAWEILGKGGVAVSRLRNSMKVIRRSKVYRFAVGPNADQTAEVLARFLRAFSTGAP